MTETLLVIDATTGQNGLTQAREFREATDVTGVVLTKLDGSAKGGIVFAIETELGIPDQARRHRRDDRRPRPVRPPGVRLRIVRLRAHMFLAMSERPTLAVDRGQASLR